MSGAPGRDVAPPSAEGEEFLRRLRARQHDAFAELVETQRNRVYSYLLHLCRSSHDAEDLTQTTFLKAWKAVGRLQPGSSPGAWLMTIARNSALNHFRQRRLEPLPEDCPIADPAPLPDQPPLLEAGANPLSIPSEFRQVPEIPKLGSGKTDFTAVRKIAQAVL